MEQIKPFQRERPPFRRPNLGAPQVAHYASFIAAVALIVHVGRPYWATTSWVQATIAGVIAFFLFQYLTSSMLDYVFDAFADARAKGERHRMLPLFVSVLALLVAISSHVGRP